MDGTTDISFTPIHVGIVSASDNINDRTMITNSERVKWNDLSDCSFENVKAVGGIMTAKFDAAYDASCSIVFNEDSTITCRNNIISDVSGTSTYATD